MKSRKIMKEEVSKIEKKEQGNDVFKAGIWYIISSIVVKTISVITTPIFTRVMTQEEYGIISNLISWYSLLLPFCTLRLVSSIGRAKLDFKNQLDKYVGSMQLLALLVTGLVSILTICFLKPVAKFMELSPILVILLILYLISSPAIEFTQTKYRYEYDYKKNIFIAWYTAIGTTLLSLFLVLCFDKNKVVARSIGMILPYVILSGVYWIRGIKNKTTVYNIRYWKYGVAISAPLIVHGISGSILAQSDRIVITKACGTEYTAIYSLVYTYAYLLTVITGAVSEAWLPWFHDNLYIGNYEKIRVNAKKLVVLGCYIGLATVAIAPEMITFLGGKQYIDGLRCVVPLVLGAVCQYIFTFYVNIELHMKKTVYVSSGTVIAAILNLVLNLFFISRYGYLAAAYTTLVSYLAIMLIHYMITRYKLGMNLYHNSFMFSSLTITYVIAIGLGTLFEYNGLRYVLMLIGFISFLYYFRGYWFNKMYGIFSKTKVK